VKFGKCSTDPPFLKFRRYRKRAESGNERRGAVFADAGAFHIENPPVPVSLSERRMHVFLDFGDGIKQFFHRFRLRFRDILEEAGELFTRIFRALRTDLHLLSPDALADFTRMLAVMAFAPAFGHTAVAGNQFGPDVIAMIPFAPVGRNEFKFFRAVFLCGAIGVATGTDQAAGSNIDLHLIQSFLEQISI
jgi:hypothetical protein